MIFTNTHTRLFKRLALLLPFYTFIRIGFFLTHEDLYTAVERGDLLLSFLLGIRFDIAALCLINAPFLILSFLNIENAKFEKVERLLFVLLNSAGLITSINDYELFNFTGKRLSIDFFYIADDILTQLPQIMIYYWHYSIVGFFLIFIFYQFDKKIFPLKISRANSVAKFVTPIVLLALCFIGIRGGLQSKSINVQSAFVQGSNELGQLVLNTPYHFIRTLKSSRVSKPLFLENSQVAQYVKNSHSPSGVLSKRNVVLIILESFSLEYIEEGYTPFLRSLFSQGLYFDKHLANGRKSIEALPSILCSIPSLLSEPFSKSAFQGNKITCLPDILKSQGYTNYFFHAGTRGTMGFESFVLSHGFDKYFAKEDYPLKDDFDGTWGIYDGPYLQYVGDKISNMPEPFMAGVFTLSSHQPYAIPMNLKNVFNKGTLEIHESIGYADWALKNFFEYAKTQPWYERTLFVITADHASKLGSAKFNNIIGNYRVPLLLLAPGHKFEQSGEQVTQHSDIPYTVLDLLGIEAKQMSLMGHSALDKSHQRAFNLIGGTNYILAKNEGFYMTTSNAEVTFHSYDWSTGKVGEAKRSEDLELRAYLQYFFNSLISNSFEVK